MLQPLVTTATLLGGGFTATAVGLARQTRAKRFLVRRNRELEHERNAARQQVDDVEAETQHLAQVRLRAMVDTAARGHRGISTPGLRVDALKGTPFERHHERVLNLAYEAISITRENVSLAARSAVRDVLDEAQTYLVRCQMQAVSEMDRFPEGTAYHQGLMNLDHLVTRSLHTVQRVRILTGSWPGLQRADCTFREIVESARGRIDPYLRVHYTYERGTGEAWVEGRVVEPITVALTELLSNAASFSEGTVAIEVQQIQTGFCIVVDDAGLNMNAGQRAKATQALSQHTVLDVTNLPDSLHLGFPVIGRLSNEYGFHVDVGSTSPYGGVRAVLRVPRGLLGTGPTPEEHAAERQEALAAMAVPAAALPLPPAEPTSGEDAALPRRRRRQPRPADPAAAQSGETAPQEDPDAFSAGFANLVAAIRDGENQHLEGDQPDA